VRDVVGRNWNRLIALIAVGFAIWIALVILSSIFGRHKNLSDDALLVGAAAGFITVLLNQVHHGDEIKRTSEKVDAVAEHVNHLEEEQGEEASTAPQKPTLGAMLRQIDRHLEEGFQAINDRIDRLND